MKQDNVLILIGIVLLIVAVFFAFDSNLSEVAPVFFLLGFVCFGGLVYRRTWRPSATSGAAVPTPLLAKLSSLLGIAGLLSIGVSAVSLFDPALSELGVAAVFGALLLIFALLLRIVNGIRSKRIDAATGGLSIVVILLLIVALAGTCLVIYLGYLLLSW